MSYAEQEAAALAERMNAAGLSLAVKAVQHAQVLKSEAAGTGDLLAVMRAGITWTAALEQAEKAFGDAAKVSRAALAHSMDENGAGRVETEHLLAYTVEVKRGVVVTNTDLVPADLMRTPPPAPDKTAIGKRLRSGKPVPGCELDNGGPATLTIRSRI